MHSCVQFMCTILGLMVYSRFQIKPPLVSKNRIQHYPLIRQLFGYCCFQCPSLHWAIDWVGIGYCTSVQLSLLYCLLKHRLSAVRPDTVNMVKSGLEQSKSRSRSRSGSSSPPLKVGRVRRSDTTLNSPSDAGRLAFAKTTLHHSPGLLSSSLSKQTPLPKEEP